MTDQGSTCLAFVRSSAASLAILSAISLPCFRVYEFTFMILVAWPVFARSTVEPARVVLV